MTSSNRNIFSVTVLLCEKPQVKMDYLHKGTVTQTFDVLVVSLKKKKMLNKHSIGRYFETPWRSFHVAVMYWIVSMVVAGCLTPIWCQDILNRHGEIGKLHIFRHAFFFAKLSRGISHFTEMAMLPNARDFIFCDNIGTLFVMTVMQSIPVWCYFCEAS